MSKTGGWFTRWWTTHTWNIYLQHGIEISRRLPQPRLLLKAGMSQGQDLAFAFVDLHEVPGSPFLPCVKVSLNTALPPAYQPFSPSLTPFISLLRPCSIPSSRLLLKSLNSIDPVLTSEGHPAASWTFYCSPPLRLGKSSQFSTRFIGHLSAHVSPTWL